MISASRIQLRPFEKGDEVQISKLLLGCFNDQRWKDERYWNWKYKSNPAGFSPDLTWLALHGDEVVSHYSIIPLRMRVRGERILAAQSVDTVTHPSYRRMRLFVGLASRVYEAAKRAGIRLIYGFPMEMAYRGLIKHLGWRLLCHMPLYVKVLDTTQFLRAHVDSRITRTVLNLPVRIAQGILDIRASSERSTQQVAESKISEINFDASEERIGSRYSVMTIRDSRYIAWRYSNPFGEYRLLTFSSKNELAGYAVVGIHGYRSMRAGYLLDLLTLPQVDSSISQSLLKEALALCALSRVGAIYCWALDRSMARNLMRLGFMRSPYGHPLTVKLLQGMENLPGVRGWYLSLGDHDIH